MKENRGRVTNAISHTILPHDASEFRKLEQEMKAALLDDQRQGLAVPAEQAGHDGKVLQEILEEFLTHPLCKGQTCKPVLYLHHDFRSRFCSFGDGIIVPSYEVATDDPSSLRRVRAVIAHELGHIISRDYDPTEKARDTHRYMNQRMERRADLIAAHLCGDGGEALADWLTINNRIEKTFSKALTNHSSWLDRVTNRIVNGLHRQYPPMEARIRYLRSWTEQLRQGEPLPDAKSPNLPNRSEE